jgi:lysozyme family protein
MDENFHRIVEFVLAHEGGYSCDPIDPGGETNWGISKAAHPNVDIKNLTREGAIAIYRVAYWDTMKCNDWPFPIDCILFDASVNQGASYAATLVYNGVVAVDMLFARIKRYSEIVKKRPASQKYLRGWINRVIELYEFTKGG